MIGRLRGNVAERSGERVVIDVGGVGYEVAVTARDAVGLPREADVTLHVHTHVREESLDLYGFTSVGERDAFRLLLSASGIGPKVAMAMLSTFRLDELRRALVTEDVAALTAVPGIGKRSAQKLILELRPKFVGADATPGSSAVGQVREALEGLGYAPGEINEAVAGLDPETPVADQIRAALQSLGRR